MPSLAGPGCPLRLWWASPARIHDGRVWTPERRVPIVTGQRPGRGLCAAAADWARTGLARRGCLAGRRRATDQRLGQQHILRFWRWLRQALKGRRTDEWPAAEAHSVPRVPQLSGHKRLCAPQWLFPLEVAPTCEDWHPLKPGDSLYGLATSEAAFGTVLKEGRSGLAGSLIQKCGGASL
ncbi:hypothetical protein NDU88_004330 [Pleurodeles waltl]|uniref:Uncharacterized protein n=1 Tax=Pleurodeles waltl TaxID=8319 RepID=A0AAV7QEF7_PLEWA|nr:hypothetical protein NDU88_004330 [Pleurodeles waltl]